MTILEAGLTGGHLIDPDFNFRNYHSIASCTKRKIGLNVKRSITVSANINVQVTIIVPSSPLLSKK
jgi:hypothetical protein